MKNKINNITNVSNLILAGICILLSAACLWYCKYGTWSQRTGESGKMFPRLVSCIWIGVSVVIIIRELLHMQKEEPVALTQMKVWHPLFVVGSCALYFLVELYVGIVVGLFVFLTAFISIMDEDPRKNFKKNLLIAIIATGVLWVVFSQVLPIVTFQTLLF
ncbi:MAG: tripartite tricarboxylate transporter TctB family protein [Eubacteriales bacterium]